MQKLKYLMFNNGDFMHTEDTLITQIKEMNILSTDTVTIHISMKSVGQIYDKIRSGAEVIIDALRKCVSDGLLLIPSHTWKNIREIPIYDVRNSVPCIGALPAVAVNMANAAFDRGDNTCIRSLHPAHSVVAFGKNAYKYTENDKFACSPMPEGCSYQKLKESHAKILLIGVDLDTNTFMHAIDEYMDPESTSSLSKVTVIDYNGVSTERLVGRCKYPAIEYLKYRPILEKAGAITYGELGDAKVTICDAAKTFDTITNIWHSFHNITE